MAATPGASARRSALRHERGEALYSHETGIIAAGMRPQGDGHVLEDRSGGYCAAAWARVANQPYIDRQADCLVVEGNAVPARIPSSATSRASSREGAMGSWTWSPGIEVMNASRGKATQAKAIAGLYVRHVVHHVGEFATREEQPTTWHSTSGDSPDRHDPSCSP